MRCCLQCCAGGGGGGVLPYIYLHEMSDGGRMVGAGRYGGGEVNSRQLMALFQVMYDPHQSTTVIKPVRKGVKKKKNRRFDKVVGRGVRENRSLSNGVKIGAALGVQDRGEGGINFGINPWLKTITEIITNPAHFRNRRMI